MSFITKTYVQLQSHLQSKMRNEEGATMVEYALMVALIAVVCITAVTLIGTNANGTFNAIATAVAPAG